MAMVPLDECRMPTLISSPEAPAPPPGSSTQAVASRAGSRKAIKPRWTVPRWTVLGWKLWERTGSSFRAGGTEKL
ncbi:hypothetical protein ACIQMJ_18235 [Actinosynnema sp. NPDC091369]